MKLMGRSERNDMSYWPNSYAASNLDSVPNPSTQEVLCVNCHRPIEPDPESISGWWKHKDGKYSCFHNTNAEPPEH